MISIENIAYLTALQNRPVALAYGRLLVAGNLILRDDDFPENGCTLFIALGEGEWDAAETVWLDGVELDPEDYHFHPGKDGEAGTGGETGDQKVDAWFPAALEPTTFSRTAYIVIRVANPELAPALDFDVRGVYRTRKLGIYNSGGTKTSTEWSANPAWQILDLLLLHYPATRIDFASFVAAASYCAATITVDGETYPRFESHTPIADQMTLTEALEAILTTCRGYLYDDQGKISLRVDQARSAVHTLTRMNTGHGSFRRWNRETRTDPNRLVMELRDLEQEYAATSIPIDREWHQDLFGGTNEKTIRLGASTQQQARRLAHYYLTRAIDDQEMVEVTALQDALHLQPGDRVDLSDDVATWEGPKAFEVVEIRDDCATEERRLVLQEYDVNAFSDAGEPRQVLDGGVIVGPITTPGVVPGPVTDLELISLDTDPEDENMVRIVATCAPPDPLEGFDGVETSIEQPQPSEESPESYASGRILPQGWSQRTGDELVTIIVRLPYPVRAEKWYLYALSRNAQAVATFVHRGGGAPTPYIEIEVPANPRGIEAPGVTSVTLIRPAPPTFPSARASRAACRIAPRRKPI